MSPRDEQLRVLTMGLSSELVAGLDAQGEALACRCEHLAEIERAVAAASSASFAVFVVADPGDPDRLVQWIEALSEDARSRRTELVLVGAVEESALEALSSRRDASIDRVDTQTPALVRRLRLLLDRERLRRREERLLHQLAFVQQELSTESEHRRLAEQAAAHRSSHDPLTDLPNRSVFEDRLETAIERAQRSGERLAVLHVNIRGFRPVNDGYGHHVGDQLLCAMGRRIQEAIRRSDTVSRLAGDDFGVILEQVQDEDAAEQLAGKLLDVLQLPYTLNTDGDREGTMLEVSVRIGVAMYPELDDRRTLMRGADRAVVTARERDGASLVFYRPEN